MINWVLGGSIIAVTLYVIIKTIVKIKKGKDICSCDGCDPSRCGLKDKH